MEEVEVVREIDREEVQPTQVQLLDILSPADQVIWNKLEECERSAADGHLLVTAAQ